MRKLRYEIIFNQHFGQYRTLIAMTNIAADIQVLQARLFAMAVLNHS